MKFPRLLSVEPRADFCLYVRYADGAKGSLDLSHLLQLGVYQQLQAPSEFNKVYLADGGRAIAWSDDLELCPSSAYLDLTGQTYEHSPLV